MISMYNVASSCTVDIIRNISELFSLSLKKAKIYWEYLKRLPREHFEIYNIRIATWKLQQVPVIIVIF